MNAAVVMTLGIAPDGNWCSGAIRKFAQIECCLEAQNVRKRRLIVVSWKMLLVIRLVRHYCGGLSLCLASHALI
jgi:hypothetical protein